MKKYREGKFEKDDVLLDIYEIVELVTLEAVEIYKKRRYKPKASKLI